MQFGLTAGQRDPAASDSGKAKAEFEAIPFGALSRQHGELAPRLSDAFARVLASSSFVLGQEVERFEAEFARYCGVRHCVGVSSGTAALMLALRSAGIGAGDEVIVPANTFVASAFAVEHAGATPVLCDVSDEDGLIDAREAESVITPSTAAVMAVHLYGQVCNMGPLRELAARHDLLLVEDAAQAHGAIGSDGKAGALGDVAAFSFYPGKNLGALGDAGAICTDDTEIADAARQLRDLGRTSHGLHEKVGYNERLDGIQAAFLRVKLEDLDEANEKRRRLAYLYRALLPDTVRTLPDKREGSVHHLFPIRNTARDSLRESLAASGIQTGVHYSPALHRQPALAGLGDPDGYPNATAWAAEELSLPLYPELSKSGARRVAEEVSANAR